jgi:hypothetical protein
LIPVKVCSTSHLELPYLNSIHVAKHTLPAVKPVQMKATNEIVINRCILTLITTPNLRAVHLFHFKKEETDWFIFDPEEDPLKPYEVKGAMMYGMQEVKNGLTSEMQQTKISSTSFIHSTTSIVRRLEKLDKTDKIFVVMVFKDCAFSTGSYYDEHLLCRALLDYRPRRQDKVIRKVERKVEFIQPNICYKEHGRQIEKIGGMKNDRSKKQHANNRRRGKSSGRNKR